MENRRLVVFGVRDYPLEDPAYAEGFDAQLKELEAWWCAPELGDHAFRVVAPPIATKSDFWGLMEHEGLADASTEDILVVFVTGHGARPPSGRHYLRMPDGDDDRLHRSHVRTAELVEHVLNSDAEHALIVVNSCFGNSITEDVRAALKDVSHERRQLQTIGLVTIGDFDDRPRLLEFKEMLSLAQERLRMKSGIMTEYLSVDEFVGELSLVAREHPARRLLVPAKVYPQQATLDPSLAIPNPGWRKPDYLVEPARRDVAASPTDVAYWLDRASGRTSSDDPGWYFSGRVELTTKIAAFLRETRGSLVVTGAAGSGKSALLARAVTLTDPKFLADPRFSDIIVGLMREEPGTVPPPGAVHAAVLARNQGPAEVLRAIAAAIGAQTGGIGTGPRGNEELRQAILKAATARPVTVVVDGVDEATNPTQLVWEVLGPLARPATQAGVPLVRFAVGVRSTQGPTEGGRLLSLLTDALPDPQVVRTDEAPRGDIAAYVGAVLDHPSSPYWEQAPDRARVAEVVADAVSPSFLDARFAARALRDGDGLQDADDPAWSETLAAGTTRLLEEDLSPFGQDAPNVLAILRASAFARGRGVPWAEVWQALAEAVLDAPIPEADSLIAQILDGRLAGYLAQDVEDDRRVYRPVHEQLAQDLRSNKVGTP